MSRAQIAAKALYEASLWITVTQIHFSTAWQRFANTSRAITAASC